jgi:hypothetical protein
MLMLSIKMGLCWELHIFFYVGSFVLNTLQYS